MINSIAQNTLRFIVLVLVQVLVLNNIQLNGYLNPYLYILFILMLPFDMAPWLLLPVAFLCGLVIDMFSDTLGMHTSATVFLAYMRIGVLRFMAPREGYDISHKPTFVVMGFQWFLTYSAILVFSHHFLLFFLEAFSFKHLFFTLPKILFSSLFSLLLIFITQMLFKTDAARAK